MAQRQGALIAAFHGAQDKESRPRRVRWGAARRRLRPLTWDPVRRIERMTGRLPEVWPPAPMGP